MENSFPKDISLPENQKQFQGDRRKLSGIFQVQTETQSSKILIWAKGLGVSLRNWELPISYS